MQLLKKGTATGEKGIFGGGKKQGSGLNRLVMESKKKGG